MTALIFSFINKGMYCEIMLNKRLKNEMQARFDSNRQPNASVRYIQLHLIRKREPEWLLSQLLFR